MLRRVFLGLIMRLGLLVAEARAEDRYYVLIFGAQRPDAHPNYSHSWAVFVHAVCQGPEAEITKLDALTISWVPRSLVIRSGAMFPEPGVRLDCAATLAWVQGNGMRASLWGPFPVCRDLFCRAVDQAHLLDSGRVSYKAVDTGHGAEHVCNCIHALTHLVDHPRTGVWIVIPNWGETASFHVVQCFEPWSVNSCEPCDWVTTVLGLGRYCVVRRTVENPHTGIAWSAARRLVGFGDTLGRGVIGVGRIDYWPAPPAAENP